VGSNQPAVVVWASKGLISQFSFMSARVCVCLGLGLSMACGVNA